jgi:hypothetical protein
MDAGVVSAAWLVPRRGLETGLFNSTAVYPSLPPEPASFFDLPKRSGWSRNLRPRTHYYLFNFGRCSSSRERDRSSSYAMTFSSGSTV